MKKLSALLLAISLSLTVFAGCAKTDNEKIKDSINPANKLERIISLAPATTQTLLHLGLGDRIIAVDSNSLQFDGLANSIPAFDMLHPDEEMLLSLNADLIFASNLTGEGASEPLKRISDAGTTVVYITTADSIEGIRENIRLVSKTVNESAKGEAIITEMNAAIDEISAKASGTKKVSVYFEISAAPYPYSFGSGTFLDEMITICGGENIFSDTTGWLAVSMEQILARDPAIIFTSVNYTADPVGDILGLDALKSVNAVKSERVYQIDLNSSSLDNEYIITALKEMSAAINP